jgi:hypothetical protein
MTSLLGVRDRWVVRVAGLVAVFALAIPAGASAASSGSHVAPVVPPFGKLYDRLSVAWWQYVLAQPAATNPLLDPTGAGCRAGQSGPVFFLVGTAGSGQFTRDQCTVRFGKLLFFPMLNAFDVHTPGDGLDTPELVYEDFLKFGFRADTLHASVDGVAVRRLDPATTPYRACAAPVAGCTGPFSLVFPDGNLFDPLPAGTYAPAVADGYYLLLLPLRPGVHTIAFGGTGNFAGDTSQDITYHLRVVR